MRTDNATGDSLSDFHRRYEMIDNFVNEADGDAGRIAGEIRLLLEGYLRVAFHEYMPPGRMLGGFADEAEQMKRDGTPILYDDDLQEIKDLNGYTWSFHHENPSWRENVANADARQVRGFAGRAIAFTRARARLKSE